MSDYTSEIPYGYCQCGCGEKTKISNWSDKRVGSVKGQPRKYINGHCGRHSRQERIATFWSRVNKNGSIPEHMPHLGNCWEWTAGNDKRYGTITWDGHNVKAHRVSWIITYGEIPDGLFVLHKCDNPLCINPSHLFLGTHQDNMDDMNTKGRQVILYGESTPSHKLTNIQVEQIRERYTMGGISQRKLAKEYGVCKSTIGYIVRRENWK